MGFMDIFRTSKPDIEERSVMESTADSFRSEILGGDGAESYVVSRELVMQIPIVQACIDILASSVSGLPIKLYQPAEDGTVEEVRDYRLRMLNSDTNGTMTASQMWRAVVADYYLGKGAHIYINRDGNKIVSLHFVRDCDISYMKNANVIFRDYDLLVQGRRFMPSDFVKVLRHSDDGIEGHPIYDEMSTAISAGYGILLYEDKLVRRGGSKKGIVHLNDSHIGTDAMTQLKRTIEAVFSNSRSNVAVLNKGAEFKELSNTAVEMQLNETKETSDADICRAFGVPLPIINGGATASDFKILTRTIMGILSTIEDSLDRDLLLEKEKDAGMYFAFDTRELNRGDIKERFEAYKTAVDANILGIDEVRQMEDLAPLGINWITLGLDSVLYNPSTGDVYTPNTNATANMNETGKFLEEQGGEEDEG